MTEQYLQQIIENCKNYSESRQDSMIFPIKPQDFPYSDLDTNCRTAQDYNYTLYTSCEIPTTFHQSSIINEGNVYVYKNLSHAIILGMHNIGKTAFLKNLAYQYANAFYSDSENPLPVIKNIEDLRLTSKKNLKKSIFEGLKGTRIVLLVDGMCHQVKRFQNFFLSLHRCIFVSSFKQYVHIPEFQVFTLEPFPVSLQILRAQRFLPQNKYLEFMERALQKSSQTSEFCKFPKFLTFFLTFFDEMKNKKRGLLYTAYLQTMIKDREAWKDLEKIALDILDCDLNIFGFQEIRNLGFYKCWNMLQEMDLFKKTDPFMSLSEITCTDIENEYLTGQDLMIKDSITEFSITADCHVLTLSNIRLIETLAAHHLVNKFEDLLTATHKSTYIESQEFNLVLSRLFPSNFLYCKKYQEVLLLFSQLCEDNLLSNLLKFILSNPSIENCFIADKILAENPTSELQHLRNCVSSMKQETITKEFAQGLTHCSNIIRNLCRNQMLKVNSDTLKLVSNKLKCVLGNCNWFMVHCMSNLSDFIDLKSLVSVLELNLTELLSAISRKESYSSTSCNYLLKLLVHVFEVNKSVGNTTQTPAKSDDFILEDTYKSYLDGSTQRLNLTEHREFGKINKLLLEALMKIQGISLKYCIKSLLYLSTKKRKVRNCLIQRAKIMNEPKIQKVLHYMMLLRVKDEESFRFVLSYYKEKSCKKQVKEILKGLRKSWVKKMTLWVVESEANEVVPAFGFCCDGVDFEVLEILMQYIDNSDLNLSVAGSEALYRILKGFPESNSFTTTHILRTLSEIFNEKLKNLKHLPEVCVEYMKCRLKILKILGDYKKIVVCASEFLENSNDLVISAVYKHLLKINISWKYFEKFKSFFDDCKFGTNGEFSLEIASFHLSWRNELSILRIITDPSARFSDNSVAKLLVQWDCVDFLKMFCNTDGLTYLPRISRILSFIETTEEKLSVIEAIFEFLNKICEHFEDYFEEFGICCFEAVVCYGKNNLQIEDWAIKYMQACDDSTTLLKMSEVYSKIAKATMISRTFERKLIRILPISPITVIKVSKNLRLLSDEIVLKLIPLFLNGSIDVSYFQDSVLSIAQKKSSKLLTSLHKVIYFTSNNSEINYPIHKALERIIDQLSISNDYELDTFVEAACKHSCGVFFEHIWRYIIRKLRINPRFYLTFACENMLKGSIAWDSKFTLKYCRILGLFRHRIAFEGATDVVTSVAG